MSSGSKCPFCFLYFNQDFCTSKSPIFIEKIRIKASVSLKLHEILLVLIQVLFFAIRKHQKSSLGYTEQRYSDIGAREMENRYSTLQPPYKNQQEYEQVA